jgi:pimeloyl-ACP methyl ester carboxylesterase
MDKGSIGERLRRAVADPGIIEPEFVEETYRMNNSAGAQAAFTRIGRYYLERLNEDVQLEALASAGLARRLLLVWGKEDVTVAYAGALAAARRLPECTLLALEDTRHVPHLERPSVVTWALSRHLRAERLRAGPVEGGEILHGDRLEGGH